MLFPRKEKNSSKGRRHPLFSEVFFSFFVGMPVAKAFTQFKNALFSYIPVSTAWMKASSSVSGLTALSFLTM